MKSRQILPAMLVGLSLLVTNSAHAGGSTVTQGPTHLSSTSNTCAKRTASIDHSGSSVWGTGSVETFAWVGSPTNACSTSVHRDFDHAFITLYYEYAIPISQDVFDGNQNGWTDCMIAGSAATVDAYYLFAGGTDVEAGTVCTIGVKVLTSGTVLRARVLWEIDTTDTSNPPPFIGNTYSNSHTIP